MFVSAFRNLFGRSQIAIYELYRRAWTFITLTLVALYSFGYYLMTLAGETEIVNNFTWWFFVTATTVGYGDYAPITPGGRIIAIFVMLVGIATLTLVIAKSTERILNIISKKRQGLGRMRCKNHVLIMGYRKDFTEKLVTEIKANSPDDKIVLCSSDTKENPFQESEVSFIRGELASQDVLERSKAAYANQVIIFGADDNQSFFTAYAVRDVNTHAHLVCFLNNEEHTKKVELLPADKAGLNEAILPVNVYLLAQELQDPGSSRVFQQMMSNIDGATLFRTNIEASSTRNQWSFEEVFLHIKREYGATVVAIMDKDVISNPDFSEIVQDGMAIFYIAKSRLKSITIPN